MPHAALIERRVAHEEISFVERPSVLGESRAGDGEIDAELVHERFRNRTDIALRRRNQRSNNI